ncbi:MAG: outer membrane beta-barrel protein [Elusimicrobiota bacterium]
MAQTKADLKLQVIGFSDKLLLEVDKRPVRLAPGSSGYSLPSGARASIVEGDALLLVEETLVRADKGDSFTFLIAEGEGHMLVHAGEVEVTPRGAAAVGVGAGQFVPLTGPKAGELPAPLRPPLPEEPAPPAAWDPLAGLARAFDKMARFKKPELRLVIEVHPYYGLRQTYDSNIYLVPPDRANGARTGGGVRSSWITQNNLGADFAVPFNRRNRLDVVYDSKLTTYSRQPKANNSVDQLIKVAFAHKGRRGVSMRAWETYLNTEDPAFSELVARKRRTKADLGVSVDHARSRRFVYKLSGLHVLHKYLDPSLSSNLNRFELSIEGEAGIRLQPKTRLFAAYGRQIIHYSAGARKHSKSHRFGLGVDGRLTAKLSGRVQADAQLRRYDYAPAGGDRDVRNLLTSVQLVYAPGSRTNVRIGAFRRINEATFSSNRYYVATGASLGASHTYHKLKVSIDGSLQTDRYPESSTVSGESANRRDDLYGGTLSADYAVRRWLSTGIAYGRRQRHSRFSGQFNYKDDRTSFNLRVMF